MTSKLSCLLFIFIIACKNTENSSVNEKVPSDFSLKKNEAETYIPEHPMAFSDSLDIKIGQMIMIGIGDIVSTDTSQELLSELKAGKAGGVILFEKNIYFINTVDRLRKLIRNLQEAGHYDLFISIDEEGGKVNRLKSKYGFPVTRSAAYLGNLKTTDSAFYYAYRTASTLSDLGFNLNFAPVVDLSVNPANPVLVKRERTFSRNGTIAAQYAKEVIKAHHKAGVKTVLKHFPGHGSSATDSHLGLTDVSSTWIPEELSPYRILIDSGYCDAVMSAHIVNHKLDKDTIPATLSKQVIDGILRQTLHYKGVVFSDDMQMHAVSKIYGPDTALAMSINAGVDILLFGNNVKGSEKISATKLHQMIKNLVFRGMVSQSRINESYKRIRMMKEHKVL